MIKLITEQRIFSYHSLLINLAATVSSLHWTLETTYL